MDDALAGWELGNDGWISEIKQACPNHLDLSLLPWFCAESLLNLFQQRCRRRQRTMHCPPPPVNFIFGPSGTGTA
jgi:hypothetical protein